MVVPLARRAGHVALLVGLLVLAAPSARAGRSKPLRHAAVAAAAAAALMFSPGSASSYDSAPAAAAARPAATSAATIPAPKAHDDRSLTTASAALERHVRSEAPIAGGADPSVLTIPRGPEAGHYLVTTGNLGVRRSTDLVHWRRAGSLFEGGRLPPGVVGDFWAPSLSREGGRYFLRYTGRGADGVLRVRSAVARDVTGPYRDLGPTVPHRRGARAGDIDPSEFQDIDGSHWLLWKHDGNAAGEPTPIYIQRLGPKGEHLVGPRHLLTSNTQGWEGIDTEAPSAIRRGSHVYVSYAGDMYATPGYNVGMLRIEAPDGLAAAFRDGARVVKHRGPVADSTSARHVGMAHGDFILGGDYFVSHGWRRGQIGQTDRETIVRKVTWQRGWPRIVNSRSPGRAGRRAR